MSRDKFPARHLQRRVRRNGMRRALLLTLGLAVFFVLPATPASAVKTHLYLEPFGSAVKQQFKDPSALAIDKSTGDLLVGDWQAGTVSRFKSDGTPDDFSALGTNVIDAKGNGQCATVPADCDQTPQDGLIFSQFAVEQEIAVDNSGTVTDGNIYVTQWTSEGGNLVDIFASSGKYLGQLTGAGATRFGTAGSGPFSPCGVATDAAGNLFVAAGYENKVYKFDPSGNPPINADLVATFSFSEPVCNLAMGAGPAAGSLFVNTLINYDTRHTTLFKVDGTTGASEVISEPGVNTQIGIDSLTGHLYAAGGSVTIGGNLTYEELKELDSAGVPQSSTPIGFAVTGMAIDGPTGRIYISSIGSSEVSVYGPLVTVPATTTGPSSITGNTSVRLTGTVDPDGLPLEDCAFEYGPTDAYGQTVPCAESPAEIGTTVKSVHADLSGLDAEALYHYRLAATNANAKINGSDQTFRTPARPTIVGQWAADVGTSEARIKAQINPENSPTTYRFEWGPDASYGSSTGEISIGSGETERIVSLSLTQLTPGTTYHYRVVATNGIGISEGGDHVFTAFPTPTSPANSCPNAAYRTGASASLPDCRAYELVSPVDKNGGDIKVLLSPSNNRARRELSSADGARFAYSSVTAFADALSAPWTSEYLATRTAQGWSTQAISPPRESRSLSNDIAAKLDVEYKAFSEDLSQSWLLHDTNPPLDPCAPAGFLNLYGRDSSTGAYEALTIAKPSNQNPDIYFPALQGVSADGTHAVFHANAKLTPDASTAKSVNNESIYQVYEHVKGEGCGELRLVSVLPNGHASSGPSSVGTGGVIADSRFDDIHHAISADGSRIFWTAGGGTFGNGAGPLYVRIDGKETLQLSSAAAQFWTAAADGSLAIYSIGEDLYEFNIDKAIAEEPATTLIGERVPGLVASSDDASRLYFVSMDQIGDEGEAGKPNLFLREVGIGTRLIATLHPGSSLLSGGDVNTAFDRSGFSLARASKPIANGVRASADGSHLAFVSAASLTGYDNTDAADATPDLEVYLYDADTDHLACISCNPSDARPQGRLFKGANSSLLRVSAQMAAAQNEFTFPRALSADGNRLFFESYEALLPRDTNGKEDVYEWMRAGGKVQCEEAGAELYVPSSGGCLSLISSGHGAADSELADASADGSDVFIRTASSLLPQDPGQVDVYDAHIDGGFPSDPSPPAICEGEACQGPLAPPNDPTPASSAYQGAGNVREESERHKKKHKNHKKAKHAKRHAKHNRRAAR